MGGNGGDASRAWSRTRLEREERRIITMLFCDVTGSTAMAQQFDPEDWTEIMNEAFTLPIAPLYRYEGTVARLMGDGLHSERDRPITYWL